MVLQENCSCLIYILRGNTIKMLQNVFNLRYILYIYADFIIHLHIIYIYRISYTYLIYKRIAFLIFIMAIFISLI